MLKAVWERRELNDFYSKYSYEILHITFSVFDSTQEDSTSSLEADHLCVINVDTQRED